MARFAPVSKFKSYANYQRRNFSGSNNDLHRVDSALLVRAQQMFALLTLNAATFPTPTVSLISLNTAISDLTSANIAIGWKGNRGSAAITSIRNVHRTTLQTAVLANGQYIQAIARSLAPTSDIYVQVATLLSGGTAAKSVGRLNLPVLFGLGTGSQNYVTAKVNRQPDTPSTPRIVFPKSNPVSGQTRLRWGKVKGATAYAIFSCNSTTGVPTGQVHSVTAASYVASLAAGQKDCIRVQAIGPFGTKSGLSQPIFFTAI